MSWIDLRGQTLSSLNNMISERNRRREANNQRIFDLTQNASNQFFSQQEADKQRQFSADQAGLDRAQQEKMAGINSQNQMNFQDYMDKMAYREYPDGSESYTDPNSGRTYKWKTNQEYQLVLEKMRQDLANDQLRLEASLKDSGSNKSATDIMGAYDDAFAKTMRGNTDVWKEGEGWVVKVSPEQRKKLLDQFNGWLNIYEQQGTLNPADKKVLNDLFGQFLDNSSAPVQQQSGSSGGGDGSGIYPQILLPTKDALLAAVQKDQPMGKALNAVFGPEYQKDFEEFYGPNWASNLFDVLKTAVNPISKAIEIIKSNREKRSGTQRPKGISQAESNVYDLLKTLVGKTKDQYTARQVGEYMTQLENEGETDRQTLDRMAQFINSFLGGQ